MLPSCFPKLNCCRFPDACSVILPVRSCKRTCMFLHNCRGRRNVPANNIYIFFLIAFVYWFSFFSFSLLVLLLSLPFALKTKWCISYFPGKPFKDLAFSLFINFQAKIYRKIINLSCYWKGDTPLCLGLRLIFSRIVFVF